MQAAAAAGDVPEFVRGNISVEPLEPEPMAVVDTSAVNENSKRFSRKIRIRNETDGDIVALGLYCPKRDRAVFKSGKIEAMAAVGAGKGAVELVLDQVQRKVPESTVCKPVGKGKTCEFKLPDDAAAVFLWVYPFDNPNMIYGTLHAKRGCIGTVTAPAVKCGLFEGLGK